MGIRVYNTLSREKEELKPLQEGKINMYVCGITSYDYCHMGHARAYVAFDIIYRYLKYRGFEVKYVQNFTNIDDKIINRTKELGLEPMKAVEFSDKFIQAYFEDMEKLGVEKADIYPKVTEHIKEIIELVQKLIEKGIGYEVDGDVYYEVQKFPEYGKLSKQPLDQIQAGARIRVDERKRNPEDFALWKKAKEGEPSWDSPWGKGRPGWHIECSAMSMKYLGETFDIHGGGKDLVFPHHENEIAQSEGATGKKFVNYWMHNGFITVDQEKMSKSLGNFFTIREVLKKFSPEAVRYFLVSTHYRSPIDFSDKQLETAKNNVEKLHNSYDNFKAELKNASEEPLDEADKAVLDSVEASHKAFVEAMDDDFNTPQAISHVHEIVKTGNTYIMGTGKKKKVLEKVISELEELSGVINLFRIGEEKSSELSDKEISELVEKRQRMRAEKKFAEADAIRDELKEKGIILEDTSDGVRWKYA